jgi:hypothetical protein
MRIEYWNDSDVKLDGTFENDPEHHRGQCDPKPKMDTSGFHHPQTRSAMKAGLWMMVSTGRLPDGTIHGITIYFENESEMRKFEQTRECDFPAV